LTWGSTEAQKTIQIEKQQLEIKKNDDFGGLARLDKALPKVSSHLKMGAP